MRVWTYSVEGLVLMDDVPQWLHGTTRRTDTKKALYCICRKIRIVVFSVSNHQYSLTVHYFCT